jgi:hypothetical protein
MSSSENETSEGFALWRKGRSSNGSPQCEWPLGRNPTFCRNEPEWPVCALRPTGLEKNKDAERDQYNSEGNEAEGHEMALRDSPE